MKLFICLALIVAVASGNQIRIQNNCPRLIWIGILGGPSLPAGFPLNQGQSQTIELDNNWSGRIWGKTNCDGDGKNCESGDCGPLGCVPASLAEITFGGDGGLDFYDVSLVDGYNLEVSMAPTDGFTGGDGGHYDCGRAGCYSDLIAICPPELQFKNNQGEVVACLSACAKFQTDEYCCGGDHGTPETCHSSDWPVNYPAIFKQACPDAYSYAYDDQASTFTCRGAPRTNYEVVFCPN